MSPVEKLKDHSLIPNWAIILFFTLSVSILTLVMRSSSAQASDNAIFRTSISGINDRLNRIENKLDNHITVKN